MSYSFTGDAWQNYRHLPGADDERLSAEETKAGGVQAASEENGRGQHRPSTILRTQRLRALVAELSLRDMELVEMSRFLACSPSGARNYVVELSCAGVLIGPGPARMPDGRADKRFRLNPDPELVERFLIELSENRRNRPLAERYKPKLGALPAEAPFLHLVAKTGNGSSEYGAGNAWRDPLVTALFGARNCRGDKPV